MKKKALSMFIVFLMLFNQTIFAGDVLSDAMSNIGNVNTYVEPDGTTNVYSGSASIRFNLTKTPPPIFTFTPPSIEAGCNGIDIKGMFMSLLGLDQLGEMLQDAGASLAWGVAVGLIYSLPGVASAFKMINSWATKIQELLGNACQTGIAIGKAIAEKSGINQSEVVNDVNDFFNRHSAKTYASSIQKGQNAIYEALGLDSLSSSSTPEMTKEEKDTAIVKAFKSAFQSDASTIGIIMKDIAIKAKGSAGTSSVFENKAGLTGNNTNTAPAITEKRIILTDTEADAFANLVHVSAGSSLTSMSQSRLTLFAYILQYNFIGDLGMTMPDPDRLDELNKIGKITSAADKAKALEAFKSIQKEKMTKLTPVIGLAGKADEKTKGKGLADFIWFGINSGQNDGTEGYKFDANRFKNEMIAPQVSIYTIRDDDTKAKSSYIAILPTVFNQNKGQTKFYTGSTAFKGTMMSSKCILDALVDGDGTIPATCNGQITFPEIHKYVKIIKESPNVEKGTLKHKLIKVMATKMAQALLEAIQKSLSSVKESYSGFIEFSNASKGNKSAIDANAQNNIDQVMELEAKAGRIIGLAEEHLTVYLAEGLADSGKIETIFNEQNKRNHERGLKSFQK